MQAAVFKTSQIPFPAIVDKEIHFHPNTLSLPEFFQRNGELHRSFIADNQQSRPTAYNLEGECNGGLDEGLFLDGRPLGVILGKAVDGNFLDPVFFTYLVQEESRVDTVSISSFFG